MGNAYTRLCLLVGSIMPQIEEVHSELVLDESPQKTAIQLAEVSCKMLDLLFLELDRINKETITQPPEETFGTFVIKLGKLGKK